MIEDIPDTDDIHRGIRQNMVSKGKISHQALRPSANANGLSVDWGKYRSPLETLESNPVFESVLTLAALTFRDKHLTVRHDPLDVSPSVPANPAHALVIGEALKSKAVCQELIDKSIRFDRHSPVAG